MHASMTLQRLSAWSRSLPSCQLRRSVIHRVLVERLVGVRGLVEGHSELLSHLSVVGPQVLDDHEGAEVLHDPLVFDGLASLLPKDEEGLLGGAALVDEDVRAGDDVLVGGIVHTQTMSCRHAKAQCRSGLLIPPNTDYRSLNTVIGIPGTWAYSR